MKQSLKKRLIGRQGATQTPDLTGVHSRRNTASIGKSLGNPVVGLATSNGTINLSEGTNKN
ncbi:MAG: hypothetical protein HWQ35_32565 [Nostoc sp. NMS1]|uniref:hypothetical protein n=1 Tax=unclassified Nostoc TaxID=2593658 RepID=UPI0025D1B94B|nr:MULTISPECIES: hypothetical protein [unclassified Nostoc]MBN3911107.1 hypothetical protein [Nostoc sp. NMS1]MBN3990024.1 hypothetical protein [Nostoc sp. NMS2]